MENWTGFLRLAVRHKEERTIPAEVYNRGAFKVTPPIYLDDPSQPCFYLMNPGGGYVGGDRYKAEIHVGERAQMLLTTQSSTKIFKTLTSPVTQDTSIVMEKDSYLEYMPDPIIAYQHAQYLQNTVIRMEQGASLIYGDIITPGWSPDGSLFRYNRLQLKTIVYYEGELVVLDHLQLRPEVHEVEGLGILEGHTHFGTMTVIGEKATSDFVEQMSDTLSACAGSCKIGLSALILPGFSLRVLASSTQKIEAIFEACQRCVREQWFGKKPISFRKY
ncbi:urease accessory protein UreD [Paenibacillus terrigena]|uniref:urease accessory protein UreD n=1 Tax=Paenibacillus terrigena TaxID=369333 RepID=UPI000368A7E9|nr:urease accessory protein UreD [Paenibacillus terrigena]